jgi:hypothetical protein
MQMTAGILCNSCSAEDRAMNMAMDRQLQEVRDLYGGRDFADKRFMILPAAPATWDTVFAQAYPHIKVKPEKKFSGTLDDCFARMVGRQSHRLFHLTMPFGTLLMDGGWMHPDLDALCRGYSAANGCDVIWLENFDPIYCKYPGVKAWRNGELIRHHAPGLLEKWDAYLAKQFISQDQYDDMTDRHKSVGQPLPCEKEPDTLSILAYHQWTEDVLMQPEWKLARTNFD